MDQASATKVAHCEEEDRRREMAKNSLPFKVKLWFPYRSTGEIISRGGLSMAFVRPKCCNILLGHRCFLAKVRFFPFFSFMYVSCPQSSHLYAKCNKLKMKEKKEKQEKKSRTLQPCTPPACSLVKEPLRSSSLNITLRALLFQGCHFGFKHDRWGSAK